MEPTPSKMRLLLVLGKARVTERNNESIKLAIGGSTTITVTSYVLGSADVTVGDILTLYTEVPYAEPKSTPVQ